MTHDGNPAHHGERFGVPRHPAHAHRGAHPRAVRAREQLAGFIAVALDLIDTLDGDSDVELNGDEEDTDGDEKGDQAWIEWHAMRAPEKRGHNRAFGEEDDEESDPPEDDDNDRCMAGEDRISGGPALLADAMGFSSRPNKYCIGMDEDCEPPQPGA